MANPANYALPIAFDPTRIGANQGAHSATNSVIARAPRLSRSRLLRGTAGMTFQAVSAA